MQLSLGTYWLSTEPDVIDWPKSKWYVTPCSSFADYSDLRALPPAPLDVHVNVSVSAASTLTALVNITNTAPHAVAFLVHLRLINDVNGRTCGRSSGATTTSRCYQWRLAMIYPLHITHPSELRFMLWPKRLILPSPRRPESRRLTEADSPNLRSVAPRRVPSFCREGAANASWLG